MDYKKKEINTSFKGAELENVELPKANPDFKGAELENAELPKINTSFKGAELENAELPKINTSFKGAELALCYSILELCDKKESKKAELGFFIFWIFLIILALINKMFF